MQRFIAEETFWNLFPDAELGIVVVKGINNHPLAEDAQKEVADLLSQANISAKKFLDHGQCTGETAGEVVFYTK